MLSLVAFASSVDLDLNRLNNISKFDNVSLNNIINDSKLFINNSLNFSNTYSNEDNISFERNSSFDDKIIEPKLNLSGSLKNNETLSDIKLTFASKINNKKIPTDKATKEYVSRYKNFSNVKFETVDKIKKDMVFKVDNDKKYFQGVVVDKKKYVVDVMGCRKEICYARINGKPFKLIEGMNITLEDGNILHVKTAKERVCDKKPVCDYVYDSYDLVEFEIVRELK